MFSVGPAMAAVAAVSEYNQQARAARAAAAANPMIVGSRLNALDILPGGITYIDHIPGHRMTSADAMVYINNGLLDPPKFKSPDLKDAAVAALTPDIQYTRARGFKFKLPKRKPKVEAKIFNEEKFGTWGKQ